MLALHCRGSSSQYEPVQVTESVIWEICCCNEVCEALQCTSVIWNTSLGQLAFILQLLNNVTNQLQLGSDQVQESKLDHNHCIASLLVPNFKVVNCFSEMLILVPSLQLGYKKRGAE